MIYNPSECVNTMGIRQNLSAVKKIQLKQLTGTHTRTQQILKF